MANYYFTYWIGEHGKEEFKKLSDKICANVEIPEEIKKTMNIDEYLFHYFFATYYTVSLKMFGLDTKQISFMLDMALAPGTCFLFPPSEILNTQKDAIPDIEKFIKKDLRKYTS